MELCPHQWANCGIARSSVRDWWRCVLISGQIVKSRVRLCATHGDEPSSVGKFWNHEFVCAPPLDSIVACPLKIILPATVKYVLRERIHRMYSLDINPPTRKDILDILSRAWVILSFIRRSSVIFVVSLFWWPLLRHKHKNTQTHRFTTLEFMKTAMRERRESVGRGGELATTSTDVSKSLTTMPTDVSKLPDHLVARIYSLPVNNTRQFIACAEDLMRTRVVRRPTNVRMVSSLHRRWCHRQTYTWLLSSS